MRSHLFFHIKFQSTNEGGPDTNTMIAWEYKIMTTSDIERSNHERSRKELNHTLKLLNPW